MNKKLLFFLFLVFGFSYFPNAQTVILDFETPGTSTTFQYFGSSLDPMKTEVIANPNPSGINVSDSVTQYVKPEDAQDWAGAFSNPNPTIPVDLTAHTQFCIKVHMDHIGTLTLKLENSSTGAANWEQTVSNTMVDTWEEICFDVTMPSAADPFQSAAGQVYQTITLFFDLGLDGSASAATSYFDDIVTTPPPVSCTTVLDFETDTTSTTFQYFGSSLDPMKTNIIANPNPSGINVSDSVTEYVKPMDAFDWAGAFSNPNPQLPVDLTTNNQVCMKVHMDHIGNVLLKLENSTTGAANWELMANNTLVNEWEEICFDVTQPSAADPFQPAAGNIYQTITLFFDFGETGATSAATSYFDDIVICSAGGGGSADVSFAVDMSEYADPFTTVYVSGTFNNWSGDGNPLADGDGDGIWEGTVNIPLGLHEYKFTLDNWTVQEAFTGTEDCVVTDTSGEFTNRQLVVSADGANTDTVCWNSCYACGESVIFTVNLGTSNITVDSTGMYIAGGGTFGVPGDFPMTEIEEDIWSITFEKPTGFSSFFTFTNGACGNFSCKEDISGQDCANPDNFNDRFIGPLSADTVLNTCFEICTDNTDCTTSGINSLSVDNTIFTVRPSITSEETILTFGEAHLSEKILTVFNPFGQVVKSLRLDPVIDQYLLDVRQLGQGMYFINVQTEKKQQTLRIIVTQ